MQSILENISMESSSTFILIDGSYYSFHRYFSIMRWWKNAHPEEPLPHPIENPVFVDTFVKTFVDNVKNIPKHLNIENENPILIVGKDCKREDIWRNALQQGYKGTRKNNPEDGFMGRPFFQKVVDDALFQKAGVQAILQYPALEGDDCIALTTRYLLAHCPHAKIFIITSDKDYLQLVEPRVQIYNLSYKNIAEQNSSFKDAKTDLFCKIVMGDASDNIPSVLKKCGPKTALKCYQDRAYFEERMKKENAYEKFEINQRMIDFNYIPQELVDGFYKANIIANNAL